MFGKSHKLKLNGNVTNVTVPVNASVIPQQIYANSTSLKSKALRKITQTHHQAFSSQPLAATICRK